MGSSQPEVSSIRMIAGPLHERTAYASKLMKTACFRKLCGESSIGALDGAPGQSRSGDVYDREKMGIVRELNDDDGPSGSFNGKLHVNLHFDPDLLKFDAFFLI